MDTTNVNGLEVAASNSEGDGEFCRSAALLGIHNATELVQGYDSPVDTDGTSVGGDYNDHETEMVNLKQENDELRQQVADLQLTKSSFPDTAWANICGEFWEDKKNQYMLNSEAGDTVDPEGISTNDLVPGGEGCYIDLRKLYQWTEDHGLDCPEIPDVETVISDGE